MPGEHTLYRKIQVILAESSSARPGSVDSLVSSILDSQPLSFFYRCKTSEGMKPECSENSIRRALGLCIDIGLINENGKLTTAGMKATNQLHFPEVIGSQLSKYMADHLAITLSMIRDAGRALLRRDPPLLPTADAIWEALGAPESPTPAELRLYLYLLAQCGVINVSQRRLYLAK